MELVVLGADGMYASPGGATSGYLLREDGFTVWIDLGSGTLANLQRHQDLYDVDAVMVSHRHPDHLVDLFAYYIARLYGPPEPSPEIPLFAPPEVLERAHAFVSDSSEGGLERAFDRREVDPGSSFEVGPFRVRTARMAHPVETMGVRIEAGGTVFAYSADTGPCTQLVELAEGADLLLAEASWQDEDDEVPGDLHLRASEAGDHARMAGAGRLVLTHIKPGLDRERSRREAAAVFDGEVLLAEQGMTIEVKS
ncbi:MAG TPA: MBL fold metallo-hydrolase [Actinomycetota bacterium]